MLKLNALYRKIDDQRSRSKIGGSHAGAQRLERILWPTNIHKPPKDAAPWTISKMYNPTVASQQHDTDVESDDSINVGIRNAEPTSEKESGDKCDDNDLRISRQPLRQLPLSQLRSQ